LIVGAGVGVGVTVGVGVGSGVGDGVGVGVGVATGVGFLIATPLFQTSFLPDFTQVYLIPLVVLVWPAFLQVVPGLTAPYAEIDVVARIKRQAIETSCQLLDLEDNKPTN
jgi:hypothetical protein